MCLKKHQGNRIKLCSYVRQSKQGIVRLFSESNLFAGGDADFCFVNGRCHFLRSILSLVTKPFRMDDAISALVEVETGYNFVDGVKRTHKMPNWSYSYWLACG